MAIKYLSASAVKNKIALVRVDLNEPITDSGDVADDFRLQSVLPTILFLQKHKVKIILASHLGRPQGKPSSHLSLRPVAYCLAHLLGMRLLEAKNSMPEHTTGRLIFYTGDITKKETARHLANVLPDDIVLLENLRFNVGEDANIPSFAKALAGLADVYVNDAFAVDHRKSASVVGVTKYLPSYGGLLVEKELKNLNYVLAKPKHPFVLMMGGIKISDKEKTIHNLARHADKILLGGGLANMLLQAQGLEIGLSCVEKGAQRLAHQLLRNYKDKIVLPKDVVVAHENMARRSIRHIPVYQVRSNEVMLDIGPRTILEFSRILKTAKTIVWNGPVGRFEEKPFHTGTMAMAHIVGSVSKGKCFGVVGGGETVDAIRMAHQENYIDHLSTGGGAMLEYLAGMKLPGLEALK